MCLVIATSLPILFSVLGYFIRKHFLVCLAFFMIEGVKIAPFMIHPKFSNIYNKVLDMYMYIP